MNDALGKELNIGDRVVLINIYNEEGVEYLIGYIVDLDPASENTVGVSYAGVKIEDPLESQKYIQWWEFDKIILLEKGVYAGLFQKDTPYSRFEMMDI